MTASTTRERILDALQDILVAKGNSAATLEAVARAASVSKGGLLYHFPTKAAMVTGLIERMAGWAEEEFRAAADGGEGVVRAFLRVSLPRADGERALFWAVIAALRGREDVPREAFAPLVGVFEEWGRLLHEEVRDPVLAETVRLAGSGMYLSAIAGLPRPDPELTGRVVDRLIEQSDRARRSGPA